ncbi:hypothetical protein [Hyphomicrobium sp.]|uniref:hypothetical protein n=1 Tax=Hyphomicrobium sp. TaxID=82 RepID=UPI002E35528E|nr:hypothetical protein [Hyphomicrobium sp.]HEX2839877.1 hypothetical protein [Hyphomicrobium sp.]
MTTARKALIGLASFLVVFGASTLAAGPGQAQEGPGGAINPGRDCQTIVTCNYTKGGSYRGCLSSYSCRVCRFVASSCTISGVRKRCYKSVCTWG